MCNKVRYLMKYNIYYIFSNKTPNFLEQEFQRSPEGNYEPKQYQYTYSVINFVISNEN